MAKLKLGMFAGMGNITEKSSDFEGLDKVLADIGRDLNTLNTGGIGGLDVDEADAVQTAAADVSAVASANASALGAATVGADIGVFTDPPSAGEMGDLRLFVNALKADNAAQATVIGELVTLANELKSDLAEARALANDLKAKYNAAVTLVNGIKADVNAVGGDGVNATLLTSVVS